MHHVGGIANETTPAEIAGMAQASAERGAIGGSLYDVMTTGDGLWGPMQAFRR